MNKISLLVTIFYVGFGTIAVCSLYPTDPLFAQWSFWALLLTFPVSVLSFGYRFGDSGHLLPVFFIQALIILPTFFTIKRLMIESFKLVK